MLETQYFPNVVSALRCSKPQKKTITLFPFRTVSFGVNGKSYHYDQGFESNDSVVYYCK